jgi:hypothetical protein
MRNRLQIIVENARRIDPDMRHLSDTEILERLFLLESQQRGSRIRFIGRRPDGQLKFAIDLTDASDGFHELH